MKLMAEFKKQLEQLSKIKRVWLTTFNLDISFVETHVLPAVLGGDPPRNRMDYETLQLALQDNGIDFRVFCDKRMLGAEQHKRTAIHVQPVAVRSLKAFAGMSPKNSLFHPKVIYLEDVNGKMILGAGSANLTISGWGRNQEAMDFREVNSQKRYEQIEAFFTSIDPSLQFQKRTLPQNDNSWNFVHSFGERNLLGSLRDSGAPNRLTVWSPYLSSDLPAFISALRDHLEAPHLTVNLVTDRIDGRYIRTGWSEAMETMLKSGQLKFFENPSPKHDCTEMTHAKIWMAEGQKGSVIAIGSWNFTTPGCASLAVATEDDGRWNNVEAGIVHPCDSRPKITGAAYMPDAQDFASAQMLEEEGIDPPELPPFDLTVTYDWQQGCYQVDGKWHEGAVDDGYWLKLPGVDAPVALKWKPRKKSLEPVKDIIPESDALLTDHFYRIEYQGEVRFQGLIIEKRAEFRRAQSYGSLQELLNSYVSEADPKTNDSVGLRHCLRNMDEADQGWLASELDVQEVSISYFRLFYAMQEYRKRLESLKEQNSAAELHKWLFVYPGCLQELAEKVREHLKTSDATGFNWFLANEVNALGEFARKIYQRQQCSDSTSKIERHKWKRLAVVVPELPMGDGRREAYIALIGKENGYVL
ncbi:hypothetical protein AN401_14185 [Zobellella denitrificans]|uniref:PLD phosphodiesterase domain-containing protein n=1 Tax=Zobellella denitrificans TaxID=347534 RepID=A0A291HRR7_9GAMM|nr:hypothetical protein [Zobellella denitrificans]ATG74863.1 hypothetical protein AN401_14185 [Zobellella denitrificans]